MGGATQTLLPCSYRPTPPSSISIIASKDFKTPKSSSGYTSCFPSKSKKIATNFKLTKREIRCRAGGGFSVTDLDLYEVLGVDSKCDQSEIKSAYRTLQKRCHPDIAGAAGHDMAIILNQVYSLLSDPTSRSAYDKEQAKTGKGQLRGYTGKPIYSVWLGSESEERAVFVDEVKCVGCLKCALLADNTFAIESVYGRARVVAQWADPPEQIQAAIQACPVDCISMVERSDLAALEFLMSKQPRGKVRVGASSTAGERVSNIFVEVKKFQANFNNTPKDTDDQILSAIQSIRSISNWLYWQSPNVGRHGSQSNRNQLLQIPEKSTQPNINKLKEAAEARKQAKQSTRPRPRPTDQTPSEYVYHEEYWMPYAGPLPASPNPDNSEEASPKGRRVEVEYTTQDKQIRKGRWELSVMPAIPAAVIVNSQVRQEAMVELDQHVGGSFALEIVNSSWLPAVLAGITWYFIFMTLLQLAQAIRKRL